MTNVVRLVNTPAPGFAGGVQRPHEILLLILILILLLLIFIILIFLLILLLDWAAVSHPFRQVLLVSGVRKIGARLARQSRSKMKSKIMKRIRRKRTRKSRTYASSRNEVAEV